MSLNMTASLRYPWGFLAPSPARGLNLLLCMLYVRIKSQPQKETFDQISYVANDLYKF